MQTRSQVAQEIAKSDDSHALIDELISGLRETAAEVVPWFVRQMPTVYFQDTKHAHRMAHLRAIIAAKASGQPPKLTLWSEDESVVTMIHPLDYPGVLSELVHELPTDRRLRAAKIHTAADGTLVVDVFEFGDSPPFDSNDHEQASKLEQTLTYAQENAPDWTVADVRKFFSHCTADYILTLTPLRLHHQWKLCRRLMGTDGTAVELERESDTTKSRIVVAVGNSRTRTMIERISTRLSRYAVNIHRAYLDLVQDPPNGEISILGFVVQDADGKPIDPDSELWHQVRRDLLRIKWIDETVLALADRHPDLGITRAEVAVALGHLVHQVLAKENPYAFARDRIVRLIERHMELTKEIVGVFVDRFNPETPLSAATYQQRSDAIRDDIDSEVDLEDARIVLKRILDTVHATLRTNVAVEERYALSLRIEPSLLTTPEREELPFGVFFVHGRGFNAFHVRFRDIARGGVRAVQPRGIEQHAREAERLYDEAYGLAHAQQLKNKDIPEGGSKAVILIEPTEPIQRCFKAFADSILDLITPEQSVKSRIIDLYDHDELLYLGPDENITPSMIEWIVDRASRRGYPLPNSFMSSKPGAGINHKEYGVTSEGLTVFLDAALRAVGIDPKTESFTVKITGGPDGDVAGNEIKILKREYGENVRIVGIADGSGSAEDPDGLDYTELLDMVERSAPIAEFNRDKLGPEGRVVGVNEPDGFHLRNTLHNRVIADAFLPGGGRPRTIHEGNWRQYLTAAEKPSSKVIVEGANLFLTPDARQKLSDAGVLIFKDSSANKCGVICSSYEIAASMVLTGDEFLSIKKNFVAQVLDKLRILAHREAELLLSEHDLAPHIPLVDLSIRLSRVIIRTSDALAEAIPDLPESDQIVARELVIEYLPRALTDLAGDRVWERLPAAYQHSIVAASLAGRIVYKEGLHFLEMVPTGAIPRIAFRYLKQERETKLLWDEVIGSSLPHRQRIASLLDRGGTRAGLGDVEA